MNDFLKRYKVKITALSPIHIGSGTKIGKKEYIYIPGNHSVIVPDIEKMYADLAKRGLESAFISFMTDSRSKGPSLSQWLKQYGLKEKDYEKWKKYKMDAGQAFVRPESRPKEIEAFIKDAYGMPYVPGSSIKGMFRTALIALNVKKDPGKFTGIRNEISRELLKSTSVKIRRDKLLDKETKHLEQQIFNILKRDEKKIGSAVNDVMAGIHVSDSRPIAKEQLTLSQKIDMTLKGEEKPLPLLRETLIPGSEIYFDVSIDTSLYENGVFPYDMQTIIEALNIFQEICYKSFYSRFRRGMNDKNIIWLGGGCGFLSKTVIYSLFEDQSVKVLDNILKTTLGKNYFIHKHNKDLGLKIAPHVCKCTRYKGELYDMGMGKILYEQI